MNNFIKFLLINTFIILSFCIKSYAEIVKKVEIQGNQRITKETIIIYGDIKIGSNYETSDVNLLIKKLYDTKFFSNISTQLKEGNLIIKVQENPIVNTIVFNGEKTKKYKETILTLISVREKSSFINNYVKSDINIIKEFYRNLGYYFTKIDAEIEKLDKNRVNLIYSINKGERAKIAKIFFLGDKKIKEKRLRDIITSQENKFWKFISKSVFLNKGRIELDKRLLKSYYKNKGYYEVQVSSSNVEYSEGDGFILTFSINAGERYKFKKISLEVSEALDKSAFSSLEKEFDKIVGDYYSVNKIKKVLDKIDKLSELKELQFINHRVIDSLGKDTVDIKIQIYEGDKFIIERINVVGNSITNDSVIRSEMIVDEGDPFSVLLVNKSINRLKGRGIFGTVEQKILEGSKPDLKVLEISVEERATGEISAGAGVGTDGTAFMAAITENNWLGRGIKLRSNLSVSSTNVSGGLAVSNPNFNYSGNAIRANIDVSTADLKTTSGYASSKTGFGLGTSFEQYENIYISPGLSMSVEDIKVQSDASDRIKKMGGDYFNMDFDYAIILDKRNQSWQPTDGYRTKFYQSIPLVVDSSSLLNTFEYSGYHSLSDDMIGSIKFLASSINGLQGEDTRLTSRLFLPQKRIRGFDSRKVGPKDGINYVGGNYATALSFEASLPNLLPETTKTDISIFMDNANVWHVDYSNALSDSSKIRSSVGVAANVWTPVGPLSFVLAQDLSKADTDETQGFRFNIGTSF
jgi:outer membrane protein insertion porin family